MIPVRHAIRLVPHIALGLQAQEEARAVASGPDKSPRTARKTAVVEANDADTATEEEETAAAEAEARRAEEEAEAEAEAKRAEEEEAAAAEAKAEAQRAEEEAAAAAEAEAKKAQEAVKSKAASKEKKAASLFDDDDDDEDALFVSGPVDVCMGTSVNVLRAAEPLLSFHARIGASRLNPCTLLLSQLSRRS
jgi:chemotaxis protein histidine kinase CheA